MLKHIGRYEILRQIGKGGMGIVYEARHTKLQKIVALKILPAEAHGDRERVARFEREMRAAGHVKHPG
ncbi:MAG: serine/threonine protein kinase, partial [Pirellula sp.]|nr:serine/threonine protein kinase [Pirellula sp.]